MSRNIEKRKKKPFNTFNSSWAAEVFPKFSLDFLHLTCRENESIAKVEKEQKKKKKKKKNKKKE